MSSKNHVWLTEMLGVLVLVVSNFGCGGGTSSTAAPAISVSVSAGTTTVQAGATTQVTATVTNDSANKGVTWSVSCSPAPCGTVSPSATASGAATTYTAPTTPPAANLTVTITATSVANTSAAASATITVPAVIAVSVTPSTATVQAGATAQFTATVTNDSANKGVTWSVSCSAAPCGAVSPSATASGVATTYTAPTTPPAANLTVTITATSVTNTAASASATITVPAGIAVSVIPSTGTVQASATAKFTATVTNDPANKGVTWTVSCSPAPCGTVSPSATVSGASTTYTAPSTPPSADLTVTITATSVTNTSASAFATIVIPAIVVSVTPSTATVQASATAQFTATVTNDPTNKGVIWTVSCSPAPCGTASPSATASGAATTYTAPSSPPSADLTVTITATSVTNASASAFATVVIPGIAVLVAPSTATVEAGATAKFTATVTNDMANKGVIWTVSCSAATCGSVLPTATASGVATTYTAPTTPPAADLTVTITATSVANTAASASATVTLPAAIALTPAGALLPENVAQDFTATVDPANKGVTWTLTQGVTACSPACGTISATTSASGTPITYTAPATLPASPTVTLTATSAADATQSATAMITITAGTVKLVSSVLDFGRVVWRQSSSPQTTTLTNTGNSTLSIAGIAITGASPGDFSETNNCATGVDAGQSCDITVIFTPVTALGTRTANDSITDNSPDSPQQVNLTGIAYTKSDALHGLTVRSALAQNSMAASPIPDGPEKVGTRVIDLIDSGRNDPYLANGAKREIPVRFWYPASLTEQCKPAEYTPPKVWNYFSKLVGVLLPEVVTNSCSDAPVTAGAHPVVVFTPGYTATFTDYSFIFEDLASRGYVVASVDHTYEATAVELPGGRLVASVFGSHLGGKLRGDDQALSFATSVRLGDLKFVVNELQRLNVQVSSPFAGKLDMSRVAVAGHSMGGATAFLALEQEPRFKAGVIIDGFVPHALIHATQTPVLILGMGRETWTDDECRLWDSLRGPRQAVNLQGAEHVTPSDALWLAKYAINTGTAGPEKTVAAIRDYIAAFLDSNLRDRPMDVLLAGTSSDYLDAQVITQEQSLCGRTAVEWPNTGPK
jgi:dienelactone hydrolase